MGILHLTLVEEGSKMKFIAVACLVAAVFAEPEAKADADAAHLYGAYGYGGYAAPYALGYGGLSAYRGYAGYAYGAYPYTYGAHYIGKRSADAEPEADPKADAALLYSRYGYASPYVGGYASVYSGYRGYAGLPYAYGGYPAYGAYSYLG